MSQDTDAGNGSAVLAAEVPGRATMPGKRVYRNGTLQYTTAGLVALFAWLLWGDFCFGLFECIFGKFMPLYLKQFDASNSVIGLLTGSIGGAMNILFLPNISMWSDRYRGRLGRRIPFLLVATPCTVLCLALIGFAPEVSGFLQHLIPPLRTVSSVTLTLILLGGLTVGFHFFNMVLVNMFRFLLRDVVPQEVMPRFLSYFWIMGTVAILVFSWYVFPHIVEHRKLVCAGVGLAYLLAFIVMCWGVREGEYPAPPPHEQQGITGWARSFIRYFHDCLSVGIYRNVVFVNILATIALSSTAPFALLFAKKTIGISMDDMGWVFGWTCLSSGLAMIPVGWLCKKVGAVRVIFVSLLVLGAGALAAFAFVHDRPSWFLYSVLISVPTVGWSLGSVTMMMELFPAEKFGQLSSSINVLGYGSVFINNYLVGLFMDWVQSNYRMSFVVAGVCFCAAAVPMALVYRGWKQHGGPGHYVPPLPGCPAASPCQK